MVLLEVHAISVRRFPFEGNRPWTIHVNAVSERLAFELMQIESREIDLRQSRRSVERIETTLAVFLKRRSDQRSFVGFQQLSEPLMKEAPDHVGSVTRYVTSSQKQ
jgi:hypothetical protein